MELGMTGYHDNLSRAFSEKDATIATLRAENEQLRRERDAIRNETLEEAARVAEKQHEVWRMPHPDDARPGEVCDDISACADIAAAIRNMKEPSDD